MKYDVIIVGAGVAGLTAAIYARRANKKVLVIERATYGGQIINAPKVNNYPAMMGVSGVELSKNLHAQVEALGAEIRFEEVLEITAGRTVRTDEETYEAGAIILAVGAEERKLDLPREDELVGHGISYCATCDGALFKSKNVAVVGGGNTALGDALYLADMAAKVYLIHRRSEFRGDELLVEKLRAKDNVEFILDAVPTGLIGEDKIEALIVRHEDDDELTLEVSAIFVAIGKRPATTKFTDLVELDDNGYIKAGEDCHTSAEGIFVAGDCRTKGLRQLVTAMSDGAIAATEAVKYLEA